eukprot:g16302.t1
MVLNIVQSLENIPTSHLMMEGRSLMKQLKMFDLMSQMKIGNVWQLNQEWESGDLDLNAAYHHSGCLNNNVIKQLVTFGVP